jgi:hypothetical protein
MIDRWGNPVCVGWPAHHLIWCGAAVSDDDLRDIAHLTGRSLEAVRKMSGRLRQAAKPKVVVAPLPISPPSPSALRALTAFEKMTGRRERLDALESKA